MSERNIFKVAIEEKFRYPFRGSITTEDLYDLNVNQLDQIFKQLNSQLKKSEEESLLGVKTKEDSNIEIMIEIVKDIVSEKLEEKKSMALARENYEKKQKILSILEKKQDQSLENLDIEELQKMAESL